MSVGWTPSTPAPGAVRSDQFAAAEEGTPAAKGRVKVLDYLEDYVTNTSAGGDLHASPLLPGVILPTRGRTWRSSTTFYDLRDEYDDTAPPRAGRQDGRYMGDWLVNHIGRVDKALGCSCATRG